MSSSDSVETGTLAALCPITGGGCVFKARALFDVIYDTLAVFPNICPDTVIYDSIAERHSNPSPALPQGEGGVTQATGGQQYILFPNPNNGNFMLQQGVADYKPVLVEISDVVGRSILKQTLEFTDATSSFQVRNVMPGLYILQLTDSEGRMFKFKFVVE